MRDWIAITLALLFAMLCIGGGCAWNVGILVVLWERFVG